MSQPTINVVVENLIEVGNDHIFGIPGAASLLLYDALYQHKDTIRSVLER
jgi:thiamine pyrophosphate-dependent acetolactate synthase large subunit-like protein